VLVTGDLCLFRRALRLEKDLQLTDYGLVLATGEEQHHNPQQVREGIRLKYGLEYCDCENLWQQCANKTCYQLEKRK
jgi:hypothetical protein